MRKLCEKLGERDGYRMSRGFPLGSFTLSKFCWSFTAELCFTVFVQLQIIRLFHKHDLTFGWGASFLPWVWGSSSLLFPRLQFGGVLLLCATSCDWLRVMHFSS